MHNRDHGDLEGEVDGDERAAVDLATRDPPDPVVEALAGQALLGDVGGEDGGEEPESAVGRGGGRRFGVGDVAVASRGVRPFAFSRPA